MQKKPLHGICIAAVSDSWEVRAHAYTPTSLLASELDVKDRELWLLGYTRISTLLNCLRSQGNLEAEITEPDTQTCQPLLGDSEIMIRVPT